MDKKGVEGEEGLSKNTLRRQHQDKADRIHVTSEKVHDGKVLRRLVRGAMKSVKVRRVLADGAYDSRDNFNLLSQSGIKPVIRVRVNSVARGMGCPSRRDAVLEQRALGPRAWSKVHRFGFRWLLRAFSLL